jgi:hypothetical protein
MYVPPPRPRYLIPFPVWRVKYAYFVDCIVENLITCMPMASFNVARLRSNAERYLYKTGHSRFRGFAGGEAVTGPRPRRIPPPPP